MTQARPGTSGPNASDPAFQVHAPGDPPYTPTTSAAVCELIAVGASWDAIEAQPSMPKRHRAWQWLRKYPEFRKMYEQAKADATTVLAEQMRQIRDDDTIDPRDKAVRLNSIQWELSRRDRAAWGDKVDMTLDAQVTVNLSDRLEQARRRAIGRAIDITPSVAMVETGGGGK